MPHLSIVIPAYNEAQRLPDSLVLIREFLEGQPYEAEVLVVNDGSSDATAEAVRKAAKRFPQLRLIDNAENRGKGAAVRQGMLEAAGEYRLFTDADYSTPITELPKLMAEAASYPVVIGSRYLHPDSIKVRQPLKRRVISRTCNWFIQRLVLPGVKDTQCGFKLFSAKAAQDVFPALTMEGWSFDIELLAIAARQGYAIKEVPVDWFDSKHSTLRARSGAPKFVRDLFTIWRQSVSGRYAKNASES